MRRAPTALDVLGALAMISMSIMVLWFGTSGKIAAAVVGWSAYTGIAIWLLLYIDRHKLGNPPWSVLLPHLFATWRRRRDFPRARLK